MGSFIAHHASLSTFSTRTNAKQAQLLLGERGPERDSLLITYLFKD